MKWVFKKKNKIVDKVPYQDYMKAKIRYMINGGPSDETEVALSHALSRGVEKPNAMEERIWREAMTKARKIKSSSSSPENFWAKVASETVTVATS